MRYSDFVFVVGVVGCGNVSHPGPGPGPDAHPMAEPDAVARRCDPSKPFGDIQLIEGVNGTADGVSDESPSVTADELTMVFASNRNDPGTPNFDLFVASRADREAPFGPPSPLSQLNTSSDERGPSVSADGLTLFFHSSRNNATSGYDLFVSTRENPAASFGPAVALGPDINTTLTEVSPFVTADGKSLYFERDDGTNPAQIFRASLGPAGFSSPSPVTELDNPNADVVVLSADELTAYVASDRPGGHGSVDIWRATRATATSTFDAPTNVTELNTPDLEFPTSVSEDGCRIFYWSGRNGFHVYQATRAQ
jgi:hypothetical protein